jgi:hypothetical protein
LEQASELVMKTYLKCLPAFCPSNLSNSVHFAFTSLITLNQAQNWCGLEHRGELYTLQRREDWSGQVLHDRSWKRPHYNNDDSIRFHSINHSKKIHRALSSPLCMGGFLSRFAGPNSRPARKNSMEADGHEAAGQPPIAAETDETENQNEKSSAMVQDLQPVEPTSAGNDEVIGGIKDEDAAGTEEGAAGPSAKAGGRKRKSVADKAAESAGTPTTRRGRSSVGETADSPAASSAKKAKGSASKAPQVPSFTYRVMKK